MRIEKAGVFRSGGWPIAESAYEFISLVESIPSSTDWDWYERNFPSWAQDLRGWLDGYHETAAFGAKNQVNWAVGELEKWVGAGRPALGPKVLDFEEPFNVAALLPSADLKAKTVLEEQALGTLLIQAKSDWARVFERADEATPPSRGQLVPSASVMPPKGGITTLYDTSATGCLYSGIHSTVYFSSPGDAASAEWGISRWEEAIASRAAQKTAAVSTPATNVAMLEEARGGGRHSHNEALAVLRPATLLGLFYPAGGQAADASAVRESLLLRAAPHQLPVFCLDASTSEFHRV